MESFPGRQSYWARNYVGWPRWSSVKPNEAHRELYLWERAGILDHIVTQNVDQLHYKAGCADVTELHGTNSLVVCMSCSYSVPRLAFQKVLAEANPTFMQEAANEIRPDGDVELPLEAVQNFVVPKCPKCQIGILKPYVVFFGDSVPVSRVERVREFVRNNEALLIVGSSLYVFSGYRFILQAKELGKPVAIINIGETRADHLADLKVSGKASEVLRGLNYT